MPLKRSRLALLLLGAIASVPALAQVPNSPIKFADRDAITTSFVTAPSLGESSGGASENTKWLKVEFHYSAIPATTPTVDSVEFKIWIEGRDLYDPQGKPNEGIAVGLTGSVTYINIAKSKDAYGVFFVHPSTLLRYSTREGVGDFERKFDVHVEAYVGGSIVDAIDKNKEQDKNWFQQLKPITGLIHRQDQCVFILNNPDRYPAIKLPAPTAQ